MITKGIENIRNPFIKALMEGKEAKLLCKDKNMARYYQAKEYTCFLKRITPNEKIVDMYNLEMVFADGKTVTTVAYIDDTIKENSIISIIGYFSSWGSQLNFYCRGGIETVYTTVEEAVTSGADLDFKKAHRFGLTLSLSVAEESKKYTSADNIYPLENTTFFYIVEDNKLVSVPNDIQGMILNNIFGTSKSKEKDYPNTDDIEKQIETAEVEIQETEEDNTTVQV